MNEFWDFAGHYWWLIFPLAGIVGGWGRAWGQGAERRHQRKMDILALHYGTTSPPAAGAVASAEQAGLPLTPDVAKTMAAHDAVNHRWLEYELDVGKLIDFPMMTDVREPLTVAFLRAKRDADALRPLHAEELSSKERWDDYRNAVNAFDVAFEVAEKEAHRLKDTAYPEPQRQRLRTARKLVNLAEDDAATPAERQAAFVRARKELEGILVLPDVTLAALEQQVARMIAGTQDPPGAPPSNIPGMPPSDRKSDA